MTLIILYNVSYQLEGLQWLALRSKVSPDRVFGLKAFSNIPYLEVYVINPALHLITKARPVITVRFVFLYNKEENCN